MERRTHRNGQNLSPGAVSKAVLQATFGMHEQMVTSMAIKMALAKLLGAIAGASFFLATASWGIGICSSPGISEQEIFWKLAAGAAWLAQCTWMGSALASLGWLAVKGAGQQLAGGEKVLLSVFGVTPKKWVKGQASAQAAESNQGNHFREQKKA